MSTPSTSGKVALRLRLPATSANLGPGFDAVAVALDFYLEVDASPGQEFSIIATGRDADRCARLEDNLILEAYKRLLMDHDRPLCHYPSACPTEFHLEWVAARRLPDAWPPLPWRSTSASWDGERIAFSKRPMPSKATRQRRRLLAGRLRCCSLRGKIRTCDAGCRSGRMARHRDASGRTAGHQQSARSAARQLLSCRRVSNLQSVSMLGLAFARAAAICCAWPCATAFTSLTGRPSVRCCRVAAAGGRSRNSGRGP